MRSPQLSFVIPTCNTQAFIAETLASVLCDRDHVTQVIVSDDGSTDDTRSIVQTIARKDPRVKLVTGSFNQACKNRNNGFQHVKTSYVCFLDGDDMVHMPVMLKLLHALHANPEAVAAYGNFRRVNEQGQPLDTGRLQALRPRPSGHILETLLAHNPIGAPGLIILRADAVSRAGGWNPSLEAAQDWELWARLALLGEFIHIGGAPAMDYRQVAGSISANQIGKIDNYLHTDEAVFSNPDIIKALGPQKIKALRRARTAHLHGMQTYRLAQSRHYHKALGQLAAATRLAPQRLPEFALRFLLGVLKRA